MFNCITERKTFREKLGGLFLYWPFFEEIPPKSDQAKVNCTQ